MNTLRVLLMTPPYPAQERLGRLSFLGGRLPSISLLYLASALRERCELSVLDASFLDLDEETAMEGVKRFAPDIVGISAVTPAISRAQNLAERIKAFDPRITTVLGGPHITSVPLETMERTPAIDVGVVGEGEMTIREIVDSFDGSRQSLIGIRGTIVRDDAGHLQRAEPRELITTIDSFGLPAYDLVDRSIPLHPALFKTKRVPAIHAITSRGCAHTCSYCNTNIFNRKLRFHSADYVMDLIKHLMQLGYREISFEDDNFTDHRTRLTEICTRLIDERIDLSWSVNARIDTVNEDMLRLMRRAGCWYISYGVESGNQETLDRIGKKITLDLIRERIELTRRCGIQAKGFFIIGFPWETEQTIRETVDFALSLPLSDLNIFPLTPFPGTAVYEQAKVQGAFDDDWSKMDLQQIVYIPPGLSSQILLGQIKKLLLRYYLRPGTVLNYLRRAIGAREVFVSAAKEFFSR
ncbi:MAG: radical SAM protein [Desulfuromonadaceae bacterium]